MRHVFILLHVITGYAFLGSRATRFRRTTSQLYKLSRMRNHLPKSLLTVNSSRAQASHFSESQLFSVLKGLGPSPVVLLNVTAIELLNRNACSSEITDTPSLIRTTAREEKSSRTAFRTIVLHVWRCTPPLDRGQPDLPRPSSLAPRRVARCWVSFIEVSQVCPNPTRRDGEIGYYRMSTRYKLVM